jgi:hypothetical protein
VSGFDVGDFGDGEVFDEVEEAVEFEGVFFLTEGYVLDEKAWGFGSVDGDFKHHA